MSGVSIKRTQPVREVEHQISTLSATPLNKIEDVLSDFAKGKMVVLVDDESRENEGDLLVAAATARPEDINFMAWHGRGLICLTLTEERCMQLGLSLMVNDNNARYATNFTVSIEAAQGVTTGISAADRAATVRAAVAPDAKPSDLVSPGHIFPLMALPGGVLVRAGHTEAGVDLARLAGREPASVICEILNQDGTMARLPDLLEFARDHTLKIGSIADLIRYRLEHEPTVQRVAASKLSTSFGEFQLVAYRDIIDDETHLALILGEVDRDEPTLVRVHVYKGMYDVLANLGQEYSWPLAAAMQRIGAEGKGVMVLLKYDEAGASLLEQIRAAEGQNEGLDFPDEDPGGELRMLGVGGQILADTGVGKMRVLGNPKRVHALSGFGLEIVDYITNPD